MRIVILGQGGREQALAMTCLRSSMITEVFVIPGNSGMKKMGIACIDLKDAIEIVDLCVKKNIDLVIPGPEAFILSEVPKLLKQKGIDCFSPSREAAQLESSKIFTKKILKNSGILTAEAKVIHHRQQGIKIIEEHDFSQPLVLKADGLAQGKGVWVCENQIQAEEAFLKLSDQFGYPLLAEECLQGRELSAFAVCDGLTFTMLGTAVDYKRITSDPFSANTGGMGAYSPCDFISENDEQEIQNIFGQTLRTLSKNKIHYRGFLFAGLMKTDHGMAVIEFNVRMGDPEAQALLPRIQTDLVQLILGQEKKCLVTPEVAVHVVMVSEGYPSSKLSLGSEIQIPPKNEIYFSAVKENAGRLVNSGGRVLGVTALAGKRSQAREQAYRKISQVSFAGAYYRKDIGL